MIPFSDAVRSRRFPFVNIAIIVACVLVFIYEITLSARDLDAFFRDYAVVPAQLDAWLDDPSGLGEPATAITAAFLHGGWLHLAGNMLYLWVFGDNVEDALGHIWYAVFYALSAVGATALQFYTDTGSTIPVLGASGAIAGVLAGYLVLYPRATVAVFIFPFFLIPVPAAILILIWFVMQLFAGVATIGTSEVSEGGVAVWAHVGGFITGLALMIAARPFVPKRSLSQLRLRPWR